MKKYRIIPLILAALLALLWTTFASDTIQASAKDVRIAVVTSYSAKPYEETLEGFMNLLKNRKLEYAFDVYLMEGDAGRGERIAKAIEEKKSTIIFAIGNMATVAVFKHFKGIPVISGVVLKKAEIFELPDATGVFLDFPLKTQFEVLKRILPRAKNIGVIYNPSDNEKTIEEAMGVAKQLGLNLVPKKVNNPRKLPEVLDALENSSDAIWAIPDKLVLNPKTAKHILLFSFRNRIPFIGLSPAWVKAGALYSLDWDYRDMGRQCAEQAMQVIGGSPAGSIRAVPPRRVNYSLNLKTARTLKIELSRHIVKQASKVYK